ncbi:hypothetical protein ACFO4N_09200 [Camelliibacillus cellulosilyticus]|uniref:Uncharacterized protein n=1 Tax=Camelliibacillus cellulosilyticus TaxID=2174486 RepID=A0ABV9GNZ4_9BACL
MRQGKGLYTKVIGWILFLFAIGCITLQTVYLYAHHRFQVEFVDNRLFYIINILCVIFLALAVILLLNPSKKWLWSIIGLGVIVLLANMGLLVANNKELKNITSLSPDYKHVLSIKEETKSGDAVYLRSYFGILARPKERLPYKTEGTFKVKWLAKDIAAVTYKTTDGKIEQFIATYGDRSNGRSYYYVGAEIQGKWQGKNTKVVSDTKGITVNAGDRTELFDWSHIKQFGTLAIVLEKQNQAVWTISLNENFVVNASSGVPKTGDISLYQATMRENNPIILHDQSQE